MKKQKGVVLILVTLIIITIVITILYFKIKNKENNNVVETVEQGEFFKIETDGTRVNTSEKLKETKENIGFSITNINLVEKENETILTASVTNNTGEAQDGFLGQIVLLDMTGNEIGRMSTMISDTENDETIEIETTITEDYVKAYDFRLEK